MAHGLLGQVRRGESMEHGLPPRHQVFGAGMGSQPTRRGSLVAETAPGSSICPRGWEKPAAGASHLPRQAQGLQRATFQSWVARRQLHLLLITPGHSPGEEGLAANRDQLTATRWPRSRASRARRAPLPMHLPPFCTSSRKPNAGVQLAQLQSSASSYLLLKWTYYYQIICL